MPIEPYLFFNGRCEEAVNYYVQAAGARVEALMRYRESPDPVPEGRLPSGWEDKIMHASLFLGGTRVMVSDGNSSDGAGFRGFALSLAVAAEADAHRLYAVFADGGQIVMPLGATFWSPCFGMVTDRFGVLWMVTIASGA